MKSADPNNPHSAFFRLFRDCWDNGVGRPPSASRLYGGWTVKAFVDRMAEVGAPLDGDTVGTWLKGENRPRRPRLLGILAVFYPPPRSEEQLACCKAMEAAWASEISREPPPTAGHWVILAPEAMSGLADLRLHPPRPGNERGTHLLDATLRLDVAECDYKDQSILVSLKEASLTLNSPSFPAVQGSFIGERMRHAHIQPKPGGISITGPKPAGADHLSGEVLDGEHIAVLQEVGEGEQEVTVTLAAGQRAFVVKPVAGEGPDAESGQLSVNKQAVLEMLLARRRGRDEQGRVIVARARMKRKTAKET